MTNLQRQENDFLTAKQMEAIRLKLLREKERILNKELEDQTRYHLTKEELSDPVDEASINIQTSHELRFRNRENFYLKKITKTLARMSSSDFGECEECGRDISFERLLARPTAEMCINCKEESELNESRNIHARKSKSIGKTMQEI